MGKTDKKTVVTTKVISKPKPKSKMQSDGGQSQPKLIPTVSSKKKVTKPVVAPKLVVKKNQIKIKAIKKAVKTAAGLKDKVKAKAKLPQIKIKLPFPATSKSKPKASPTKPAAEVPSTVKAFPTAESPPDPPTPVSKPSKPVTKKSDKSDFTEGAEVSLTQLNKRLVETEKKLAVILSWIRNQYGEDHSIIQVVKASLGQPLEEELINNIGKPTPVAPPPPLFVPPSDTCEYPRHVWIPRDSISKAGYEHAFKGGPSKPPPDFSWANMKLKVIGTDKGIDAICGSGSPSPLPPNSQLSPSENQTPRRRLPKAKPAKRPLRPLELLEAEMGMKDEDPVKSSTSRFAAVYTDSEDDHDLLHEPAEFETLSSMVEAAAVQEPYEAMDEEDEGPSFQILSTTSLATPPRQNSSEVHYNCNDCNKRFISVRQLAKHSLEHNSAKYGLTPPPSTSVKASTMQPAGSEAKSKATKGQGQSKPASASGLAPKKTRPPTKLKQPKLTVTKRIPPPRPKIGPKSKTKMLANKKRIQMQNSHGSASGIGPIRCEHCGKQCTNRSSYNYHKIIQHNAKKTIFICSVCRKCCTSSVALKEHQLAAHGGGDGASNSSGGASTSTSISNGIQYTCRHCNKKFGSVGQLGLHLKTHYDPAAKPVEHKCEDCGHTFKNGIALGAHLKSVHGIADGSSTGDREGGGDDNERSAAAAPGTTAEGETDGEDETEGDGDGDGNLNREGGQWTVELKYD